MLVDREPDQRRRAVPSSRRGPRESRLRSRALVATIGLVGLMSACSSNPGTTVGGCAIEHGAACQGTYMRGGDITRGDLFAANLNRADLRHATLVAAILTGANLTDANLQGADLRHAHLERADLNRADLRGARFERAWLAGATFLGAQGVDIATIESGIVCRTVVTPGVVLNRDC